MKPLAEYNTNPFDFFSLPSAYTSKTLMFGVELEMELDVEVYRDEYGDLIYEECEHYDEDVLYLRDKLTGRRNDNEGDWFITKDDGSLTYGIEVCTMPFTLRDHKSNYFMDWQRLCSTAVNNGAKSGQGTRNCGMHVHINRSALSQLTLGKMLVVLNEVDNPLGETINRIAQRSGNSYARAEKKRVGQGLRPSTDKYERLNVKSGTAEVRIFKGNLRPERIYKNLEFCHCLVRYCQSIGITEILSKETFCKFLRKRRKDYPNLFSFCVERDLFPASVMQTLSKPRPPINLENAKCA